MESARRYNLLFENVVSCGLGTYSGNPITYSLLGSFYVNYDTVPPTNCTYPAISIECLMNMSSSQYYRRVRDFLCVRNIQSGVLKNQLLNTSSFDDPSCETYYCKLNSNFLVYKFLTGIRVVNVGVANGEIQYKAYLTSNNPDNYEWQTSPTFLDLIPTGIYVIQIRDVIDGETICIVEKIINMSTLIPSTTIQISPKTVAICETNNSDSTYTCFSNGCFKINPTLTQIEKVQIDYTVNATAIGGATSCVQLNCKPNGSTTCSTILCHNQLCASPKTGTFTLCYGDIVYYNTVATTSNVGSSGNANIRINSVSGLGTTIPTIDNTRCYVGVSKSAGVLGIAVNLVNDATSVNTTTLCSTNGTINFTPAIPAGSCVTVGFSAVTTTVGGSSNITLYCKPNGGTAYLSVCNVNNTSVQPRYPSIIARYGDCLCYTISASAPIVGTCACAKACLNNLTASIGINPTYGSPICISTYKEQVGAPTTISLCNQNYGGGIIFCCANGFINASSPIPVNQCVVVNYVADLHRYSMEGDACIKVLCKPVGEMSFITVGDIFMGTCLNVTSNLSFTMRCGDIICYNMCAKPNMASTPGYSCATLQLSSAIGYGGNNPTIDTAKRCDSVIAFDGGNEIQIF